MEEVIREDQERSLAKGRSYASGPPTVKASLCSAASGYRNKPATQPFHGRGLACPNDRHSSSEVNRNHDAAPKRKTVEEVAAVQEKKRKLMAKYG
jgi:hypothetical protein